MKKMSIPGCFVLASLLLLSTGTFSQTAAPFKVDPRKFSEETITESSSNLKVANSFNKMFPDAFNIQWSSDKKTERAYFKTKGKATRAVFNKKGQFLYSITTYSEEYLPKEILFSIKKTYFGKSIFGVVEVNALSKTAYLIALQDRTSWLHIKVLDGEITEEKVLLRGDVSQ